MRKSTSGGTNVKDGIARRELVAGEIHVGGLIEYPKYEFYG